MSKNCKIIGVIVLASAVAAVVAGAVYKFKAKADTKKVESSEVEDDANWDEDYFAEP